VRPIPAADAAPRWRRRLRIVGIFAAALTLVASPWWGRALLQQMDFFRVRRVEIEGARYASPDEIVSRLRVDTTASIWDDVSPLEARVKDFETQYGVRLELVHNDKGEIWNNAYSLWCARAHLRYGVLLANGDTVHPASVQQALLDARADDRRIILALDTEKPLADEEMKVSCSGTTGVDRISKQLDPTTATGEYIGLTLIEPAAAADLTTALEQTWQRDPQLYYEDAYQLLIDQGFRIDTVSIGHTDWVEIDNQADLDRAREIVRRRPTTG